MIARIFPAISISVPVSKAKTIETNIKKQEITKIMNFRKSLIIFFRKSIWNIRTFVVGMILPWCFEDYDIV